MASQIQEISQMIKDLGSIKFESSLFSFFDSSVSIAQCTIFQIPRCGKPKAIIAMGHTPTFDRSAKSLAIDYVNGLAEQDPHLSDYRSSGSAPHWHVHVPELIDNAQYRAKFYEQPRLACDLTMTIPYTEGVMIASIYRSHSQGVFQADEMQWFEEVGGLCANLIERHVGTMHWEFSDSVDKRCQRFKRIMAILRDHKLSAREAEICTLIMLGHTTCGIALELDISENTVGTHRKRAYAKLGIATQNELFSLSFDALASNH